MEDVKKQLVDKIKTSNNILISVSRDPNVDQLAACLGLALFLNKQGKHAAAVFSGQVPSTIEFLQPEDTIEKNTDSLRDFIIALDKSKADKLRYKVEDNVVRIFITPYKTSITQEDLEFSQGDFNVDLMIALGVDKQEDLDEAITAHGRILHDATVASINLTADGGLGSLNWHQPNASSLCELVTDLAREVDANLLDGQIATALLTGIVAQTDRFRNEKTSPQTMSASAALLSAGANQQLVASKLEEPVVTPATSDENPEESTVEVDDNSNSTELTDVEAPEAPKDDGEIDIDHDKSQALDLPSPTIDAPTDLPPEVAQVDDNIEESTPTEADSNLTPGPSLVTEEPTMGGTLTANSEPPALDPSTDPLSVPTEEPPQLLSHEDNTTMDTAPVLDTTPSPLAPSFTPPPSDWTPPADPVIVNEPEAPQTLSDMEADVKASETEARDEVNRAINASDAPVAPQPIDALNAQPLVDNLNSNPEPAAPAPAPLPASDAPATPMGPFLNDILSDAPVPATPSPAPQAPVDQPQPASGQVVDPTAPPPVPPPIPFQFGNQNPPQQ